MSTVNDIPRMCDVTVFGVDNYNALGVLRSLGIKGIKSRLIVKDTRCNVAYLSKYVSHRHVISSYEEGLEILKKLIPSHQSLYNFVITNDDKAQAFLDMHYEELKGHYIIFNCSGHDIRDYMDKYNILQIAKSLGLDTLDTVIYDKTVGGKVGIDFPVVTKAMSPLSGRWKGDFYICHNQRELDEALEEIPTDKVLIQRFVDKKNEYCIDGYSYIHGWCVEFSFATTYNYNIQGYYSPYMTVHEFDESLYEKLRSLIRTIQFEGIFSIEFLIDKDGKYYFSEINLRNSTWSYIGSKLGRNIPYDYIVSVINYKTYNRYCYPIELKKYIPKGFTAVVEPIDYQKRVVERGYSRLKWIRDVVRSKCPFYFDIHDLRPFFHMLINNKRLR